MLTQSVGVTYLMTWASPTAFEADNVKFTLFLCHLGIVLTYKYN